MTSKARSSLTLRSLLVTLTLGFTIIIALSGWTLELTSQAPSATDELLRHVNYLASDELTGRGVAWTEERRRSDEGRLRLKAPRRRTEGL